MPGKTSATYRSTTIPGPTEGFLKLLSAAKQLCLAYHAASEDNGGSSSVEWEAIDGAETTAAEALQELAISWSGDEIEKGLKLVITGVLESYPEKGNVVTRKWGILSIDDRGDFLHWLDKNGEVFNEKILPITGGNDASEEGHFVQIVAKKGCVQRWRALRKAGSPTGGTIPVSVRHIPVNCERCRKERTAK